MVIFKASLFASVSAGSGIVLAKIKGLDGRSRWSAPSAFAISGGGGGLEFGGSRSEVLVLLNTDEQIAAFTGTSAKLAMGVQAALGPLGRSAEGGVAVVLEPDLYADLEVSSTYGGCSGLALGVGLSGMVIVPRDADNAAFYRADGVKAEELLSGAAGLSVLGRHEDIVRCAGMSGAAREWEFSSFHRLHRGLEHACGGSGRAERFETAESRGTPF